MDSKLFALCLLGQIVALVAVVGFLWAFKQFRAFAKEAQSEALKALLAKNAREFEGPTKGRVVTKSAAEEQAIANARAREAMERIVQLKQNLSNTVLPGPDIDL